MNTLLEKIDICLANRQLVAAKVAQTLADTNGLSELELSNRLKEQVYVNPFHDQGWYNPPPNGIGTLFTNASDNFERSKFPTLRTEPYSPSPNIYMDNGTVGMVYVSPIDKATGVICDIGFNFYRGKNKDIQNHLSYCLETVEEIAKVAEVGLSFQQLQAKAQTIVDTRGLHNDWMITYNDPTRAANFGHTFPWSYEDPNPEEEAIMHDDDFKKLKTIIEHKRLFINPIETFVIPKTIAFSIEARLGSRANQELPCGYYYMLVTFREGKRKIVSNLNPIFDRLGMTYITSEF